MTPPELDGLREVALASETMAGHLHRLGAELQRLATSAAAPQDDRLLERRHAFLRMFEQIYDVTARRLFRGALLLAREDFRTLSYKHVVRRLEQLDVLADGAAWLRIGDTRNMLVHDYAVSDRIFADHIARALVDLPQLLDIHAALVRHLRAEGLFS